MTQDCMKSRHFWQERIYRLLTALKGQSIPGKRWKRNIASMSREVLVSGVDMERARNTLIKDLKSVGQLLSFQYGSLVFI